MGLPGLCAGRAGGVHPPERCVRQVPHGARRPHRPSVGDVAGMPALGGLPTGVAGERQPAAGRRDTRPGGRLRHVPQPDVREIPRVRQVEPDPQRGGRALPLHALVRPEHVRPFLLLRVCALAGECQRPAKDYPPPEREHDCRGLRGPCAEPILEGHPGTGAGGASGLDGRAGEKGDRQAEGPADGADCRRDGGQEQRGQVLQLRGLHGRLRPCPVVED